MAEKRNKVHFQVEITTGAQWREALLNPSLIVIDVYQRWCGPCKAVRRMFQELQAEYGEDILKFGVAEADSLQELSSLRGKCQPVFLFYTSGKLVSIIKGVNGPLLQKTIFDLVEQEKKKQELGCEYVLEDGEHTVYMIFVPVSELSEDGVYHVVITKPDSVFKGKAEEITKKFVKAMTSGPVHAMILSKGKTSVLNSDHAELVEPKKRPDEESVRDHSWTDANELSSRQLAFFFPTAGMTGATRVEEESSNPRILKTIVLIHPNLLTEKDEILQTVKRCSFQITIQGKVRLSEQQATVFYKEQQNNTNFSALISPVTSEPLLALALVKEDAVQRWRGVVAPETQKETEEDSSERYFLHPVDSDSYCNTYQTLTLQMSSICSRGLSVMMILSKNYAMSKWRPMTSPEKAERLEPNSLHAKFVGSILENATSEALNVQHAIENISFIFEEQPL
ncbi:thioredoxin domain-containing protein 6-like [Lampris incognitus]|uniref:thioredoxin domain-containing protein 6-like n=1 Tax=Lampris incognitus TaxID=2546036 RepID=UPI0024B56DE3|nr:thioredoxin domain-containing protein 6-like [Lampris incognitus]